MIGLMTFITDIKLWGAAYVITTAMKEEEYL